MGGGKNARPHLGNLEFWFGAGIAQRLVMDYVEYQLDRQTSWDWKLQVSS